MATKVACTLPRLLPNGHGVPCVEERGEEKRPVVAFIENRDLDAVHSKHPDAGTLWIPLGDDWDRTGEDGPGTHYISAGIGLGHLFVWEWRWDELPSQAPSGYEPETIDLDYDFADDDGVETIHIHRGEVDLVVPVRAIPDDSEVPRPPLQPMASESPQARRRRNGLC